MTELLSNEGYKAHSVSDGQQAIDCLNDFEPDCILLDIKMPRLNGFEALRLIRFHQPNSEVIMVTALAQVKIIEECMRFGAFGYITKPIELSHLLKEVRAALNHKNEASAVSRKTEDPSPEINQDLQEKNRKLKSLNNLLTSELFEALKLPMEMVAYIYPSMGVHSWNVAWISREIGKKLGVATKLCELAGLYHDIGKLCLPSQIMAGHWENFNPREKNLFEKFPLYGEEMIQYHEHLEGVAHVIRHQFERIDGRGYPDGLKGKHIPLHSKILAVSNFFDEVLESEKIREIPQIMAQGILYFNAIKRSQGPRGTLWLLMCWMG